MGSLFWKIFLWFWLTLIIIAAGVFWGTALYVHNSDTLQKQDLRSRYLNNRIELLKQVIYHGGEDTAANILKNKHLNARHTRIYVIDEHANDILGRSVDFSHPKLTKHGSVSAANGETYTIFSLQKKRKGLPPPRFLGPFSKNPSIYLLWLGIALFVSALVCFLLARYLTRPIHTLQHATKALAQGALDTRVAQAIGSRRDEIADLGQDFDRMASRLQSLVNNQKQLLSDISHELRSPLARMQLAIGLARKKIGDQASAELERIEQETERLNDLVSQSLTLSRLDAGAVYAKNDFIELGKLLQKIINDCDFEAAEQQKTVNLTIRQSFTINANSELLHRALENIIRNAIRYTQVNTAVEVEISPYSNDQIKIAVSDNGHGIPENKIAGLFEPFVRLSEARDRDSGGYGLGLAIAKRAVELHEGSISARNKAFGGLVVEILLPQNHSENT